MSAIRQRSIEAQRPQLAKSGSLMNWRFRPYLPVLRLSGLALTYEAVDHVGNCNHRGSGMRDRRVCPSWNWSKSARVADYGLQWSDFGVGVAQSAAAKCAIWSACAFTKNGRAVARAT
jgi:hypothetical protein